MDLDVTMNESHDYSVLDEAILLETWSNTYY
jgi:hypothetical protein